MTDHTFSIQGDSPIVDKLMFWRIVGHEVLARPSAYELTVLTDNESIEPADVLGRAFDVAIEFEDADGGTHKRHCHGHAVRFTRAGRSGRFIEYRISLRSWFWLLSKRVNARILQNKPVLDVIDAVLDDSPVGSLKKIKSAGVVGPHAPHGYCVQYRESDYQFLSRLLEEEGIYYWFDAHDAPGTLHLSDTSTLAHEKLPAADTLHHAERDASEGRANEITRWISSRQFESGKFASRDRDFKVISKQLFADKGDPDTHELSDLEVFEFPGGYASGDDTDNLAQLRLDELIARRQRHWALTGWPDVTAGRSFAFKGDPEGKHDGDYLIAACTFVASHPGYEGADIAESPRPIDAVLHDALADDPVNTGLGELLGDLMAETPALRSGQRASSSFLLTVVPLNTPWRPPRLTPRVTMPGPQSAIVTGRSGEQIWTEEHGRVKVQFHWDRYGKNDENSSCWVRSAFRASARKWSSTFWTATLTSPSSSGASTTANRWRPSAFRPAPW
ncbi:type VI secretion system Vgr family protein [Variovorax sp. CCNWLW235]|uniref:type VI secretion system Vgr family protein n=1 Tax=Variovorax sp. CCNWLW235 TaxID=3127463 RepID=UPI003076B62E